MMSVQVSSRGRGTAGFSNGENVPVAITSPSPGYISSTTTEEVFRLRTQKTGLSSQVEKNQSHGADITIPRKHKEP